MKAHSGTGHSRGPGRHWRGSLHLISAPALCPGTSVGWRGLPLSGPSVQCIEWTLLSVTLLSTIYFLS